MCFGRVDLFVAVEAGRDTVGEAVRCAREEEAPAPDFSPSCLGVQTESWRPPAPGISASPRGCGTDGVESSDPTGCGSDEPGAPSEAVLLLEVLVGGAAVLILMTSAGAASLEVSLIGMLSGGVALVILSLIISFVWRKKAIFPSLLAFFNWGSLDFLISCDA